jgi:hypothetical protein
MAKRKVVNSGRLALRVEGNIWNAYYAMPDTMEGALWLGSIAMGAVTDNPGRKADFMRLMRGIVTEFLQDMSSVSVTWPEHERSGSA